MSMLCDKEGAREPETSNSFFLIAFPGSQPQRCLGFECLALKAVKERIILWQSIQVCKGARQANTVV